MKKFLIGLLIGIIVGIGCLFTYNEVFVKKENSINKKQTTEKEETKTEEELSINSQLVQTLYNYVLGAISYQDYKETGNFFYSIKTKSKINASDLSQELKNYLGFRQLKAIEIEQTNCSSNSNLSYTHESGLVLLCGGELDHDYDPITNTTQVSDRAITYAITEELLKEKVELIFGKNNYKSVDFLGMSCDVSYGYVYNKELKEYLYVSNDNGCGFTFTPSIKLISATKKDNNIYLIQKVEREASEYSEAINMKIKYTFTLADDGNYYFESVEKIS